MANAHAGRMRQGKGPGGEQGPPAPLRWGFPPKGDAARRDGVARPDGPEPGDRLSGDGEFDRVSVLIREANSQPLPGALPTMRFWMVVLAAMAMVVVTAVLILR